MKPVGFKMEFFVLTKGRYAVAWTFQQLDKNKKGYFLL